MAEIREGSFTIQTQTWAGNKVTLITSMTLLQEGRAEEENVVGTLLGRWWNSTRFARKQLNDEGSSPTLKFHKKGTQKWKKSTTVLKYLTVAQKTSVVR